MKTKLLLFALATAYSLAPSSWLHAATTIDPANQYAYGANLGWVDWRGDTNNGAVIGEYVCAGYIYSANAGWIHLGSNAPANGIRYQNDSGTDYGVNHDGFGNLRGYAWGANIGWINFEATGAPTVDLLTGKLSGYAFSANCGWISLSNATALLKTVAIRPGIDSDNDGLPDAWELQHWGNLRPLPSVDSDGDGRINLEEYLAGTDPSDTNSVLRITNMRRGFGGDPTRVDLVWTSEPTRFYAIEKLSAVGDTNVWSAHTVFPWMGVNNAAFNAPESQQFYRIRAFRPLMP